jgi:hypothetical protein
MAEASRELVRAGRANDRHGPAQAEDELVRAALAVEAGRASLVGPVAARPESQGRAVGSDGVRRGGAPVLPQATEPRADPADITRTPPPRTATFREIVESSMESETNGATKAAPPPAE